MLEKEPNRVSANSVPFECDESWFAEVLEDLERDPAEAFPAVAADLARASERLAKLDGFEARLLGRQIHTLLAITHDFLVSGTPVMYDTEQQAHKARMLRRLSESHLTASEFTQGSNNRGLTANLRDQLLAELVADGTVETFLAVRPGALGKKVIHYRLRVQDQTLTATKESR